MDDYKEKYESALDWMRKVYPTMTDADKEDAEHYFPELAESEDEKIREELIQYHADGMKDSPWFTQTLRHQDVLTWLEKQKEQKPVEIVNYPSDVIEACMLRYLQSAANRNDDREIMEDTKKYREELLAIIMDIAEATKPAEWSEEDEKKIERLRSIVNDCAFRNDALDVNGDYCEGDYAELDDFLKSLLPQPHWKPSNLELGALRTAISVLTEERNFQRAGKHLQDILDHFEGKETRHDWKPSEEQPEVDLEKEIKEWLKYGPHTNYSWRTIPDAIKITAEHFFELGLNARKEE